MHKSLSNFYSKTGNFILRHSNVQETVDTGFNFTRGKDFSADTNKADAVVAAFKVGLVAFPLGLLLNYLLKQHAWAAYGQSQSSLVHLYRSYTSLHRERCYGQ